MLRHMEHHYPAHGKRIVLVVDDVSASREVLEDILSEPCEVIHASHSSEVSELLRSRTDPATLVLVTGLQSIETQARREQEYQIAQSERAAYSRIARALAQDYFCIYSVDIRDNSFVEYSSPDQSNALRRERQGSDFFHSVREEVLANVYQQDRDKAEKLWSRESILRELRNASSFSTTYRVLIHDEPHYVRFKAIRMQEDTHQLIIGVSNIDAEMRRELAFMQAQELALRDDLTGVKNKRSYSQAEQTLLHSIAMDHTLRFAVVVADVNELKLVNDTEGHSAGDQYVRTACALICSTFVHSPVYRIGGDEFVALLFGQDYDNRGELIQALSEKSARCQSPRGLPILSCGISDYLPGRDQTLTEVFERSDNAMYLQKSQLKAHRPS